MKVQAIRGTINGGQVQEYTLGLIDLPTVEANRANAVASYDRASPGRDREGWLDWLTFWNAVLLSLQTTRESIKLIKTFPRNLTREAFATRYADGMRANGWNFTDNLHPGREFYPRAELVTMGRDAYDRGFYVDPDAMAGPRKFIFDQPNRRTQVGEWIHNAVDALATVNPLFVAARAAVLALVAGNFNGLADKMHAAGPEKMRANWEGYGGDWSKLAAAIAKGRGVVQGIGFLPVVPVITTLAAGGGIPDTAPGGGSRSGGGGLSSLWKIAEPIIGPLLSLLGLNPSESAPTAEQVADDASSGGNGGKPAGKTGVVLVGLGIAALLLSSSRSN